MRISTKAIFSVILWSSIEGVLGAASYRFAPEFQTQQILANPSVASDFVNRFITEIAAFHSPNVGYDAATGMTLDGMQLDFAAGEPLGPTRQYSAASKEALHVLLCSLAIAGNVRSQMFLSPELPSSAVSLAKELLRRKLDTIERFDCRYPGFAGFLPWFLVVHGEIAPAQDWARKMPVLDNGQLAWALIYAEAVLRESGDIELANRIQARIDEMAANFERVFWDSSGIIRAVAGAADPHLQPTDPDQQYEWVGVGNDPAYAAGGTDESELAILFAVTYGAWTDPQIPIDFWNGRRTNSHLARRQVIAETASTQIAVQQQFWFSAHEQWPTLQFPYLDDDFIKRVFVNGERFRTRYSQDHAKPGCFASAHEPVDSNRLLKYASALGIPGTHSRSSDVIRTDVVSPYAAFPVILADEQIGLAFLHTMLLGPKVQTPYGVAESISVNGDRVGPVVTWDGNATLVLALALNEEYQRHGRHFLTRHLQRASRYSTPMGLLRDDYVHAFPSLAEVPSTLVGETVSMGIPSACIPHGMPDYPLDLDPGPGDVFAGTPFEEGFGTLTNQTFDRITLRLPISNGYVFSRIRRVPFMDRPILTFGARCPSGWMGFEIKNAYDKAVLRIPKAYICLSTTSNEFRSFGFDLRESITQSPDEAAVVIFSDPSSLDRMPSAFELEGLKFVEAMPSNVVVLEWDGLSYIENPGRPVNLLSQATIEGFDPTTPNALFANHFFDGNTLALTSHPGFVFWRHKPVDYSTRCFLAFEARTTGGQFFLEIKNTEDRVVHEIPKLAIELPNTGGAFQSFALDLKPALFVTNSIGALIAISDPTISVSLRNLLCASNSPAGSRVLHFDVRRYAENPGVWRMPSPFHDWLPGLNFVAGAGMRPVQNHDLLLTNRGFAFAIVPRSIGGVQLTRNVQQNPFLCLIYAATRQYTVDFELKNSDEQPIAGNYRPFPQEAPNLYKLHLLFPNTSGKPRLRVFDLRTQLRSVTDYAANVLAVSDPDPTPIRFRIIGFGLAPEPPSLIGQLGIGVANETAHVFFYNGDLQTATSVNGPWATITSASNGYNTPALNNGFFRLITAIPSN